LQELQKGCLCPVSFSGFEMDPFTGHFGGEIRLAYLYTDEGVKLLTGGCLGVLWILDIINIATGKLLPADGSPWADEGARPQKAAADSYAELEKLAKLHEQGVLSDEEYALTVECSKGTYIRTLCADIGAALGCGGAMQSLARIKAAGFSIDEALTLDALSDMSEAERDASVIDTEALFLDKPRLTLPPFFLRLLKNGCEIYQKKIGTDYEMGSMLRLYDENGFFALGEVQAFENGSAVKMIKLLREEK